MYHVLWQIGSKSDKFTDFKQVSSKYNKFTDFRQIGSKYDKLTDFRQIGWKYLKYHINFWLVYKIIQKNNSFVYTIAYMINCKR